MFCSSFRTKSTLKEDRKIQFPIIVMTKKMDGFSKFKESEEDQVIGSAEALRRWRSAGAFVTNPRRRFRMVVDLARHSKAEKEKLKIQEKIRVAICVQKAALEFIEKQKLEDGLSREYIVTESSEALSIQESVDDVGSTVKGHDVCQPLGKHETCARAVIYIVLEAASFFLDLFGKNKRGILLAAFLLSVFSFAMSMYTCCIMGRTRAATRLYYQKQQVRIVEIAFSVVQLVVTLIYFILAELGVKNNFSASVFPLVFAIIVAVFTFKYNEEVSDSSGSTDHNLSEDSTVENLNPVRDLNMINSLASPVPPASDRQLNRQCLLLNTQVHMPNSMPAQRANDLAVSTCNEDAEADVNLSTLATVTS